MPFYDRRCTSCMITEVDLYEPVNAPTPACKCGQGQMERVFLSKRRAVTGDECDVWIKNGLCWDDGSPRHFTSKAEIARVAAEKHLGNFVRHVPKPGTDKSPHTVRWIAAPVITEEERLRRWYEHEATLT